MQQVPSGPLDQAAGSSLLHSMWLREMKLALWDKGDQYVPDKFSFPASLSGLASDFLKVLRGGR